MAKEYAVKCPYCKDIRKMKVSDLIGQMINTNGIRGVDEPKPPSPESTNEDNWIDLKKPCPNCGHTFSFNYVTGESRE